MTSSSTAVPTAPAQRARPRGRYLAVLSLTALGVVYGDIGTSPLYAVRECFFGLGGVPVTRENVLGILSLIFWTLVVVVSAKYHVYVIRADNRGEGGILALMALVRGAVTGRRQWIVLTLGLFGAALLYGDGIITPAISVLGAFEGLDVATPLLSHYVVPLSITILVGLFLFQRRGTAGVGRVFGPVILVWFGTIAVLGVRGILMEPVVLQALSPIHAVRFFAANGLPGFTVLGAVFLVATGGEALYADLGHFGERAIQIDWFTLVGPALLLNYLGQGALLLASPPGTVRNPFYQLAPSWALYPLVSVATMAAIIASQAIISGAFSLTRQAVQLGYLPRVNIVHTSAREIGQIYIPGVNWVLAILTIGIVLVFRSSSGLAHAYGVAVTTTMVVTTALAFVVTRKLWRWPLAASVALTAVFLSVDLAFFTANAIKVEHGGWFPLVIAGAVYIVLTTWHRGRALLRARVRESAVPLEILLADVAADPPTRVPGTAVFLTPNVGETPASLVHNLAHNNVLHQQVLLVSVLSEEVPSVPADDRVAVRPLGDGFHAVTARYGFMEEPSVPDILALLRRHDLHVRPEATTFFLGRETLMAAKRPAMARWRQRLFALLSRNALSASAFFGIPPGQVFEVGAQVEL
jgi:KUP system potassium uptake protein